MVTALHVSQLPRFKELQLFEPSKNRPARRFFRLQSMRLRSWWQDLKKIIRFAISAFNAESFSNSLLVLTRYNLIVETINNKC